MFPKGLLMRLLAFALHLLGVNRKAVAALVGMPEESVKTAVRLAMRDGFVPPTLNLNDPDPQCDLNHVANQGAQRQLNVTVKIAAGFGGHIGIVVLERGERTG